MPSWLGASRRERYAPARGSERERYAQKFAQLFELTEAQTQSVKSILKEMQQRAAPLLKVQREKDSQGRRTKAAMSASGSIELLFDVFKGRVDALLTMEQLQRAKELIEKKNSKK